MTVEVQAETLLASIDPGQVRAVVRLDSAHLHEQAPLTVQSGCPICLMATLRVNAQVRTIERVHVSANITWPHETRTLTRYFRLVPLYPHVVLDHEETMSENAERRCTSDPFLVGRRWSLSWISVPNGYEGTGSISIVVLIRDGHVCRRINTKHVVGTVFLTKAGTYTLQVDSSESTFRVTVRG